MEIEIFYTYVLKSLKDNHFYIGFTSDIEQRMKEHQMGSVISTKYRRPLMLVYYEVCFDKISAIKREKYLKTTYGHRYLKNRIQENTIGLKL